MPSKTQKFGTESEKAAAAYLARNGYEILLLNYRNKIGEIDIIAKDGETLVFAEVKARRSEKFGSPRYAVNRKKMKKLSMVALFYLKETGQTDKKARFDVVSVVSAKSAKGGGKKIEIIKNAFDLAYF